KKRLKNHFKRHFTILDHEMKGTIKTGVIFNLVGILLMFFATYVLFVYKDTSLVTTFLVVFLEPGGWFFFWEGLNLILFESKKMRPKLEFYKKMYKSRIDFFSD
ncbi:hypothetical protein J4427_03265, partial [Candidatus Woesearchaeota archaeon]|nr:hypothetical protein [Candidatus Woesearchaeota archaeon]